MDFTSLPTELFYEIFQQLTPIDCLRLSWVSKRLYKAIADNARRLLVLYFPLCRENRDPELGAFWNTKDCIAVFSNVSRRYHNMRRGTPLEIDKIGIRAGEEHVSSILRTGSYGEGGFFGCRESLWTYDRHDGLIVYPQSGSYYVESLALKYTWRVSGGSSIPSRFEVPFDFDPARKRLRRLRLACRVLVFEWTGCDGPDYNGDSPYTTYYAEAFDVRPTLHEWPVAQQQKAKSEAAAGYHSWTIAPRCKWVIREPVDCGGLLVLDSSLLREGMYHHFYRTLSTHTSTHYAFYQCGLLHPPDDTVAFWIQRLQVWEMTPRGKGSSGREANPWRNLTENDLHFCRVGEPGRFECSVRGIELDVEAANIYLHEEATQEAYTTDPTAARNLERGGYTWWAPCEPAMPIHGIAVTGIPLSKGTLGPFWRRECSGVFDDGNLITPQVPVSQCPHAHLVLGRIPTAWDQAQRGHRPDALRCWRHDRMPFVTLAAVEDDGAGVRYAARLLRSTWDTTINIQPTVWRFGHGPERLWMAVHHLAELLSLLRLMDLETSYHRFEMIEIADQLETQRREIQILYDQVFKHREFALALAKTPLILPYEAQVKASVGWSAFQVRSVLKSTRALAVYPGAFMAVDTESRGGGDKVNPTSRQGGSLFSTTVADEGKQLDRQRRFEMAIRYRRLRARWQWGADGEGDMRELVVVSTLPRGGVGWEASESRRAGYWTRYYPMHPDDEVDKDGPFAESPRPDGSLLGYGWYPDSSDADDEFVFHDAMPGAGANAGMGAGRDKRGAGCSHLPNARKQASSVVKTTLDVTKFWKEIMYGGKLEGDERWLIGEDVEGRVSIVRW